MYHPRLSQPTTVNISRACFYQCVSGLNQPGGAIYMYNIPITVTLNYISFIECTAGGEYGGALSIEFCQSSYFYGCCFTECSSTKFANAMLLKSNNINKLTGISIDSCFRTTFRASYNTIEIADLATTISDYNATNNRMTNQGPGLRVYSTKVSTFSFTFLTIVKNEGNGIMQVGTTYVISPVNMTCVNLVRNDYYANKLVYVIKSDMKLSKVVTRGNTAMLGQTGFDAIDQFSTVILSDSVFDTDSTFVLTFSVGANVDFRPGEILPTHAAIRVVENDCHNMCSVKRSSRFHAIQLAFVFIN